MERKFESELGKRIQEGKSRGCTINMGIIAVAVVSFSLLVGSAVFLLPVLAAETGKPLMEEYAAIAGEDDYLVYVADSGVLVHDDGDGLADYDVKRIASLRERTYTSPNSAYYKEYNTFVYNINVVLRDLSEMESADNLVLGTLTIPYTGGISAISMSMALNQVSMPEYILPATVAAPTTDSPAIFVEVFLPELILLDADGVPAKVVYVSGDNIQIQVSVKVPFFHDLYPEDDMTAEPVPGVVEEPFPEYFDVSDLPVADAGTNQIVYVDDVVILDGTASTDNVAIVSYVWTYDCDGVTEEISGDIIEVSFPSAGDYIVTLTVEDEDGLTDFDRIRISVLPAPESSE